MYSFQSKIKCLKCGSGLFLEKGVKSITCPKCTATWAVLQEDGEMFLEQQEP